MRSAKRVTWAVLLGVIGLGLVAIIGVLVFVWGGNSRPVNPGAALSELISWGDPGGVGVGAAAATPLGTPRVTPDQARGSLAPRAEVDPGEAVPDEQNDAVPRPQTTSPTPAAPSAAIVVMAALPVPTTTGSTTTTEPTATAASTAAPAPTESSTDDETAAQEPPPGAQYGVTYCGANTCGVGLKCCCESCVPFEQACDPRSCAAQSGLSISVPCGMDLCDPGEICCDARCGECARMGECPAEPCN